MVVVGRMRRRGIFVKMSRLMRSRLKRKMRILIFLLGRDEIVLVSTRRYLLSREGMLNSEGLCLTRDGLKIKMYGHLITTSSGLPKSMISTSMV